jgi:hypothetical protein
MSRWRAALLAGLLVGGLQTATHHVARAGAARIDRSPFGLSIEYPLVEKALGSGACPSHALAATLRSLGSPTLRIGGDSQDLAGPTAAYHYLVPTSFWPALGCLARESGVSVVVGLNFAEGPVADDETTIAAAEQAIPPAQLSFSLGNEPDLYGISHILPNEADFTVPAYRAPPWTAEEFASEWTTRRAQLGQIPLEGPDLAGIGWRVRAAQMLQDDPPVALTVHAYPTVACGSAGAPTTAGRLLSKHASVGLVEKYEWLLATSRATHRPAIISESNSGSCGGKPGVSDKPVASVWAARYVVAAMLAGFAQVRFHTAGTSYDPIVIGADGSVAIRPLGHALLFLHRWIPIGSHVLSSSHDPHVLSATVSSGQKTSVIVSSFQSKPMTFSIPVESAASHLHTDTLTTFTASEIGGSVAVRSHRAQLTLAPNTVVAIRVR